MSVINAAALIILGLLLLRKLVLMERFFEARVYLLTGLLYVPLFIALCYALSDPACYVPPPTQDVTEFRCSEF